MIRRLATLSVRNHVAVNLATITVLVGGIMAYFEMPREVFPEFTLGTVTVTTIYPGAAPEDVERLVTLKIEDRVGSLDGERSMSSVSQEGYSQVTLTTQAGVDMARFLDDVRSAVLGGDLELPDAVDDPVVREIKTEFPAIGFFVYGKASAEELRVLAERHQRNLERIDGVSQVILQGVRDPRIWVEVDPISLERYGLTLGDVGRAVGGRAVDQPIGSLSTPSGDFLMRVESGVLHAEDLRTLPIVARPDGTTILLSDVARVLDTFEREVTRARYNGQSSVYLRVNKEARGDAIDISREVYAYIEREQPNMPPGTAIGTNADLSVYVRNRLNTMRNSALVGGVLVLVSLILFLDLRIALMTALGIPVAFLGGLLVAYGIGITMNMLTMFALIVVLGMIVDDAIVVGENAYRLMEEGLDPETAAIEGTAEVGMPVLATILTTISAFLPTLMIGGTMGKFMRPLPLIVSFCLIASLLEALLVLPAHLARWTGRIARTRAKDGAQLVERRWYDRPRDLYVRMLGLAVRWRYVTAVGTAVAIALLVAIATKRIPFVLFDDFESKVFSIDLRMDPGTSIDETDRMVRWIDDVVRDLPPEELDSTNSVAGVSYTDASRFTVGQNLAQVWVELREGEERRRPTREIIAALRERFRDLPAGVQSIELVQPQAGPTGRAIDISVRGPELSELERISEEIQATLRSLRGTRDVHDNAERGKREVRIELTEEGRLLGYDERSLGAELRASFEGTRFARIRRGKDDVEVVVKLPERLRDARGTLERLPVGRVGLASAAGADAEPTPPMLLGDLARVTDSVGPAVITRDDGERSVRVLADVDKQEGNAARIADVIRDRFGGPGDLPPGYSIDFKGEERDSAESFEGIEVSFLLALFGIYVILGALFKSLVQPAIIMSAIPFGAVGMIIGHLVMGRPLSFLSLIGLVALAGIVVNDSLILQELILRLRRSGLALEEALLLAGRRRFRPILLTSVTTMLGLTPLTFFSSGQARFLQPMAISVFFGLCASTGLILLVIPALYAILEDLTTLVKGEPFESLQDPEPKA